MVSFFDLYYTSVEMNIENLDICWLFRYSIIRLMFAHLNTCNY